MDLEGIMLSAISQIGKDIYHIISFIYGSYQAVQSLSCVQLLATPWIAAYQAPLSMGFSKQEYWSGVPLPSPRDNYKSTFENLYQT